MDPLDFISQAEPQALEQLYQQYRNNPESVDGSWRLFFKGFDLATASYGEDAGSPQTQKEFQVIGLIQAYRERGHLFTKTNPVRARRVYEPDLSLSHFGLTEADLKTVFQAGTQVGLGPATLQSIVEHLEETYCHSIGIEYVMIQDVDRQAWVREHIELANRPRIELADRIQILKKLSQATLFEEFLQKKFVGQKRFSLEGGETLIAALDAVIESGTEQGVEEVFIGMAHRGRLSTLAHILGKPYEEIFCEFEGKAYDDDGDFDGDVKYHLGYSRTQQADSGNSVSISLAPNPSHLEAVGPVVEGLTRARIDATGGDANRVLPILIHGDAALAGQGVVYEVAQMAQLDGYHTGGTVHIVVNNQVGFTTNYLDGRSSIYCTDVSKVTESLSFHVNADDAEAVVQVMRIALAYRQRWNRDVYIDLLGYRKYGHNEGDEPMFTQPQLYKAISKHPNPLQIYIDRLLSDGSMEADQVESIRSDQQQLLERGYQNAQKRQVAQVEDFLGDLWKGFKTADEKALSTTPKTSVAEKKLRDLAVAMSTLPEGKKIYRKVARLMRDRLKMIDEDRLDWALGELLAYASLLVEGHPVRISGQDVERGTFSHRHAVVKTEDSEEEIIPLNHLSKGQADLTIYNSLLSEYAVVGFDYGYAFATPNGLTIWEAQFGDFNNGAQILFDQFLSAAEDKWRTMNGLTLLLPHGYEGMGSEHSSGRMERFLQLGSGENMFICNVTEPANYFHLLRRQVKLKYRKPLVVFTPKKLLRYPKAVSTLAEMATGGFKKVIDDPRMMKSADARLVDTVVLCSGKIYYDLLERLEDISAPNLALVRVEQIHPLPDAELDVVVKKYGAEANYIWVQEEPKNMGAWSFMLQNFTAVPLSVIARSTSASPASGSSELHKLRQDAILDEVFAHAIG
ncbi:MAG: 2-oxoglutarate dehydrogenase E1 component [Crocinitomicaceae bacterium]|nr:2-oxoglutarate dehydrogenase E1 component [Crocinitomicaceae bacterium]